MIEASGYASKGASKTLEVLIMSSATMPSAGQSEPLYGGKKPGRVTVRDIAAAKARGEKWPMLTTYDALTAGIFDEAGIPVLHFGDSAGNVVFGYDTTIPVTVDDLIPLTAAVVRGTKRAMVVADLPFRCYQARRRRRCATRSGSSRRGRPGGQAGGRQRVAHPVEEVPRRASRSWATSASPPSRCTRSAAYSVQGRSAEGPRLQGDAAALEQAGAFSSCSNASPRPWPRG